MHGVLHASDLQKQLNNLFLKAFEIHLRKAHPRKIGQLTVEDNKQGYCRGD